MSKHQAAAQPEKRLFISLITRDISLADAALDLIDNAINSAIIARKKRLNSPADYIALLDLKPDAPPAIDIRVDKVTCRAFLGPNEA